MSEYSISQDQKYFELDYVDLPLPLYLKKRLEPYLENNDIPNMLFFGFDVHMKLTIANAVAKKTSFKMDALIFSKEPKSKSFAKGDQTLLALKQLLDQNYDDGFKRLFVIDYLPHFPKDRLPEIAKIIVNEPKHRFIIFNNASNPLNPHLRFLPQIPITFLPDHSIKQKNAYIHQYQTLINQYNIERTPEEFEEAMKMGQLFWSYLLGKPYLSSRTKLLAVIDVIKIKGK